MTRRLIPWTTLFAFSWHATTDAYLACCIPPYHLASRYLPPYRTTMPSTPSLVMFRIYLPTSPPIHSSP